MIDEPSAEPPLLSSWYEAELLAGVHMRQLGFSDALTTAGGADGGIDVVATGAVAQVKHYSSAPIGSPAIQRLHGAALGRRAIFYSLIGYTMAAKRFATEAEVTLFSYDLMGVVRPENDSAELLVEHHHVPVDVSMASESRLQFIAELSRFGQGVIDSGTVVLNVMQNLMMTDLETIQNGQEGQYVRPENLPEITAEIFALQESMQEVGQDEMPISQAVQAIIRLEGRVQALSQRFGLSYEDMARVGASLRAEGILGSDAVDLETIVMQRISEQRDIEE
ncbi:restriction endonuclease [Homoserinimonas sp. A447]